ncbi:hypothetical protein MUP77_04835 [Candidatus Bathyarchaeota archaeon]|nr:hypothetical protein [Candidatus Bathyarchaeota archaeon]
MVKYASCGKEFEFPNYLIPSGSVSESKEIYPTCPYYGSNLNECKKKTIDARGKVERLVARAMYL